MELRKDNAEKLNCLREQFDVDVGESAMPTWPEIADAISSLQTAFSRSKDRLEWQVEREDSSPSASGYELSMSVDECVKAGCSQSHLEWSIWLLVRAACLEVLLDEQDEMNFVVLVPTAAFSMWPEHLAPLFSNAKFANPGAENEPAASKGWTFSTGQAAWNGKVFDIGGVKEKLLQALVSIRGGWLSKNEMKARVWNDGGSSDENIRRTIHELRNLLRQKLGFEMDFDPLDRQDGCYRLNERLRQ